MKGDDWPIVGYVDRFSVAPGGTLGVMVSTVLDRYTANVVRLGGSLPQPVEVAGSGTYRGRSQDLTTGSYVVVPHSELFDNLSALTVQAWILPTLPNAGRLQGLVAKSSPLGDGGWGLYLDDSGRLLFKLQTDDGTSAECRSPNPLNARRWYHVSCSYDGRNNRLRLTLQPLEPWREARTVVETDSSVRIDRLPSNDVPLLIGAGRWHSDPRSHAEQPYDGKIENPSAFGAMLGADDLDRLADAAPPREVAPQALLASWDFSIGISSTKIEDSSPNQLHGTAINMPMRAATGHLWRASEQCYTRALDEYAAIHFHSDDLSDACWQPDFHLQIPSDISSGVYAVRLTAGSETDDIPFFVVPGPSTPNPIAFLAPTYTYLAYGNRHSWTGTGIASERGKTPDPADLFLARHPEVGRGLYDRHADGSGCCYSSSLRPLVQLRPDYRSLDSDGPRHFSADLLFLQWLERKGYAYDVITDAELHARGDDAISRYRVVVTGSHPEYYTAGMIDALHSYVRGGGRLMYLGGNGFYWVTSVDENSPHIIEVRRGFAGTRDWSSEPGELYHSTTGEMGGLWRHRGRSPNQLVGVGFGGVGGACRRREGCTEAGQCWGSGYYREAGSFREETSFIFDGVAEDEIIGGFGTIQGGAAGDEVDRLDMDLGSPPSACLLASAALLHPSYRIATEDIDQVTHAQDGKANPVARADMVYLANATGGAVFSVGSISWFGSLNFKDDENNVSRITENVLRRFLVVPR